MSTPGARWVALLSLSRALGPAAVRPGEAPAIGYVSVDAPLDDGIKTLTFQR